MASWWLRARRGASGSRLVLAVCLAFCARPAGATVGEFLALCWPQFGDVPALRARMAAAGMRAIGPEDGPRLAEIYPHGRTRLAWQAPARTGEIDAFAGFSVGSVGGVTTEACWYVRRPGPGMAEAGEALRRLHPPAPGGIRQSDGLLGSRDEWTIRLQGEEAVMAVTGARNWPDATSFMVIFRIRPVRARAT